MLDVTDFDSVFKFDTRAHLSNRRAKDIARARSKHAPLFFDLLLDALGLADLQKLYPPHDNRGLRELHAAIVAAENVAPQHQQALLFYLIRDLHTAEDEAGQFAKSCGLARQYVTAISGLWEMDRQEYKAALEHLTQPFLTPTFAPEILDQLLRHSKDPSLPLAYYHAVSPPLAQGSKVRSAYFAFLTRLSPRQALSASRGEPDAKALLELVVRSVLSEPEGPARARAATELVDLPLGDEEEAWFEGFLRGEGAQLVGATDTLVMRRIAMGRGAEVVEIEGRLRDHKVDGVDWGMLKGAIARASGGVAS